MTTVPASLSFFDRVTHASPRGRQEGSVLITLIVSMVIFAVLGAAMYSLFSTSRFGVSSPNDARRTYYLAESGLRYTLSEARNSPDVIGTLLALNNRTFQVAGSGGFTLTVNPYFGSITGDALTAVGTNQVTVGFAGSGFPENFTIPVNARLQIGINNAQTITAPASIAEGATSVAFTLGGNIQLDNDSAVLTVFHFPSDTSSQTINQGGDLTLNIPTSGGLPVKNGAFVDNSTGIIYQYHSAEVQGGKVVLSQVTWNGGASATFAANADLLFSRAARVNSSGARNQTQKLLSDTFAAGSGGIGAPPPNNSPVTKPNDLTALDVSDSGGNVTAGSVIPGGTGFSFQGAGAPDPQQPGCTIGFYVVPLSDTLSAGLRNSRLMNGQLSYDVQSKALWDPNLPYGVTGITFRWHENPVGSGLYEGFGISFMRFKRRNVCSGDGIPNSIKATGQRDKSLLVLWQQQVVAGSIQRKWLAYALLGNPANRIGLNPVTNYCDTGPCKCAAEPCYDEKVVGNQGPGDGVGVHNDSAISVRIEDTVSGGARVNNIKLFWGDASPNYDTAWDRGFDSIATNILRERYDPQWLDPGLFPRWPANRFDPITNTSTLAYWHPEAHTIDWYDHFGLASSAPQSPVGHTPVTLVFNPSLTWAADGIQLLNDGCTIQTNYFTLGTYEAGRAEIGLHAMGNLNSNWLAMQDFSIQILGVHE